MRRRTRLLATIGALTMTLAVGATPTTSQASPPTAAGGTITQVAVIGFELRLAGPNLIVEQATAGSVSGSLSGSFEDGFRVVIHPNGRFNAHGTLTCACTVDGRSGVLELALTNSGEEVNGIPTFEGRYVITRGTGELSGLRGVLEFKGAVDLASGLSTITYSGQIHFHP